MNLETAKNFDDWKTWIVEATGEMDNYPDFVKYREPYLYVCWNVNSEDNVIQGNDGIEYYDVRNTAGEIEDFITHIRTTTKLESILESNHPFEKHTIYIDEEEAK